MEDITITERLRARIGLWTEDDKEIFWTSVWIEPGETASFTYPEEGLVVEMSENPRSSAES